MLFNSIPFLLFFPLVAALYFFLPRRTQWGVLLVASCTFYMTFRPVYILIPACTIVVDYFAALTMERTPEGRSRNLWFAASLCANLGALVLFKYFNFFNQLLTSLLAPVNLANPVPFLKLLAPVGLSFHVFRSLAYTIEVYRGTYRAERHFGIYALYVLFFPELISGPIERPKSLLPQLRKEHGFVSGNIVAGARLALFGFFKKVMIADRLGPFVAQVYDHPRGFAGLSLAIATVAFLLQLYCDFSGYTDVARGIGRMLGLELAKNFDRPFFSKSMSEFWRRWHISLSTWFRDYVFIPLALTDLARRVESIALIESVILLITFLVAGLWHGAAWTFVLYGALHGIYLASETLLERPAGRIFTAAFLARWNWPMRLVRVGLTFSMVCSAAIFFRADSVSGAWYVMTHLASGCSPAANAT